MCAVRWNNVVACSHLGLPEPGYSWSRAGLVTFRPPLAQLRRHAPFKLIFNPARQPCQEYADMLEINLCFQDFEKELS